MPTERYQQLVDAFNESDFFDFHSEYTASMSDLPTTYVYYTDLRNSKEIKDYYGSPQALKDLEERVEALVNDLDWKPVERP